MRQEDLELIARDPLFDGIEQEQVATLLDLLASASVATAEPVATNQPMYLKKGPLMTDQSTVTYRPFEERDFDDIAQVYTHIWTNNVEAPDDKILCGSLMTAASLLRSTYSFVAEVDGRAVGVGQGCIIRDGQPVEDERWRPTYELWLARGEERAKTADRVLEGAIFGDLREYSTADRFIATGSPYAEAELNFLILEPSYQGLGIGRALFTRVCDALREGGASRFFLMTDTESNWELYEHYGMTRIAELPDPDDPGWASLMYGGEL